MGYNRTTKTMKIRFKMWNNDNNGFRVTDCFFNGLTELKNAIKELRQNWQNVEAYNGDKKVAAIYNA